MFNWIKTLLLSAAHWTETEQTHRERERERYVCARWESKTSHSRGSTGKSQKLNKVWMLFEGRKVTKGVCNVAKLTTLCISISPTTGWATGQTENTRCINRALKGWLTGFFLGLIVFMGCSQTCSCLVFLKNALFFTQFTFIPHLSVPSLINALITSWFYEAPSSEIRDGLWLVSWSSVLWFAKPPLLHVWTSCPSPHVLRLYCNQCIYIASI